MLGVSDRHFLPKPYLDKRKKRFVFPRFLKRFGIALYVVFFAGIFYFLDALPVFLIGALLLIGLYNRINILIIRRMLVCHRGRVCPCCWRASNRPTQDCPGCHAPAGRTSHRRYWRIVRLHGIAAEQWFADLFRVQGKTPPWTRRILLLVLQAVSIPILIVGAIVLITIYLKDLNWMSEFSGGAAMWGLLLAMLISSVNIYFAKRRAGDTRHCAKCDYQMVPEVTPPKHCPECGAALGAGAIVTGKTIGNPWLATSLSVLFPLVLVGFVFFGTMSMNRFSPTRLVPIQTLVDYIIAEQEVDYEIWYAIEDRRLNDAQILQLLDEMEARLKVLGPNEDIPDLWDYYIGKLIVTESTHRLLGKPVELRLLWLYEQYEQCDAGISIWVADAIDRGVYSDAELQAARSGSFITD